jgi:Fe-Mn family superoxide dismutase
MTRRRLIKVTTLAAIAAVADVPRALSQGLTDIEVKTLEAGSHPFILPPLPYAFSALEPHVDARTLEIHHGYDYSAEFADQMRHFAGRKSGDGIYRDGIHASYVKALNKTIARNFSFYSEWRGKHLHEKTEIVTGPWLEGMLKNMGSVPETIRNDIRINGGGHYNHTLFWQMMKKGSASGPRHELAKRMEMDFGGVTSFKEKFSKASTTLFGSGWAWLTLDGARLKIETTANEDTPVSAGREVLLGIDLWEHAYYLKYQNRRADYVAAWFNVVNWDFVTERYLKLKG